MSAKAETLREAAEIMQSRGYYSDGTPRQLRAVADEVEVEERELTEIVFDILQEHFSRTETYNRHVAEIIATRLGTDR